MKRILWTLTLLLSSLCLQATSVAGAADIRAVYRQVAEDLKESRQLREETSRTISLEKKDLKKELARLQQHTAKLKEQVAAKEATLKKKQQLYQSLSQKRATDDELMTNLTASVRISAKQLQDLMIRSPLSALAPQRPEQLNVILDGDHFPGLDDMKTMADLFFAEMEQTGQVTMPEIAYTDRSGHSARDKVLLAGPFLAVHAAQDKSGLLRYSAPKRSLAEIDAKLPGGLGGLLKDYLRGKGDTVPLDLTAGAAFEQLVHHKGFVERIKGGGVLVWPILALAVAAVLIGIERAIFLMRLHDDTDRTMSEVNRKASEGDWDACQRLIDGCKQSPAYNVVRAGLQMRHEAREILESVLQEAILKELPRLERALPLLNIMAAVAPLLGLLGTVTGMIGTFEVINIYGTGDPRMMSGGISVALVTTMLGLIVAIPIMLMHTFLSRQVEHVVGDMEEKAVALTNIIHLHSKGQGVAAHESAA